MSFVRRTRDVHRHQMDNAKKLKMKWKMDLDSFRFMVEGTLGGKCPYCDERLTVKNFSLDHMEPLSRGGTYERDNLQIVCRGCNRAKGRMNDFEFRAFRAWVFTNLPEKVADDVLRRLKAGGLMFKRG